MAAIAERRQREKEEREERKRRERERRERKKERTHTWPDPLHDEQLILPRPKHEKHDCIQ